ncbi:MULTISPECIES: CvpA family protein [Sphingobium]|jgi:membrane protein required for colicin V production|uniref:Colicin V production protein n=2 Tax=Sphingobium fuliginis (strain ATCC 27551) TaxID=336203 RepID=A0A292ZIF7_SPHSA|nr:MULTISPECIES: CvpA family protein [Sphingobium]OAP31704.1 colicin V production protein [Sphingobium sp. 20006FA]AJR24643.1 colicin V production protein [Sphingobium sp. YBL2]KXU29615.1 colicin V production protein [Sphingobium sp. AM]KYC31895.1 colicin V production protein [Sphingobium sp. 22B]MCB4858566.1 CvpA family protein [Sphingobium sp. PNB]
MNAIDILVLLLIGGCAIFGLMRGFVQETLSLIAWVLAIFAIRLFHASATELAAPFVGSTSGAAVLAFALVFGITFGAGKLLAHAIGRRTRQSVLGPVDRVLGAGFGAVKGLIGATLVFLAFSLVYDTFYGSGARRPDWLSDARTYPLLNASGQAISEFVAERRARKPSETD